MRVQCIRHDDGPENDRNSNWFHLTGMAFGPCRPRRANRLVDHAYP